MDALWLWNIALASTACGNLLNLIETAYGYPESKASIERGSYLETVEWDFAENISDVELASGTVTKEADVTEMCGEAPPSKRRKTSSQGPDKCKLAQAIPMTPSTTMRFHQMGVAKNQVSERKGADGQSIYRCNVTRCEYITDPICSSLHTCMP